VNDGPLLRVGRLAVYVGFEPTVWAWWPGWWTDPAIHSLRLRAGPARLSLTWARRPRRRGAGSAGSSRSRSRGHAATRRTTG